MISRAKMNHSVPMTTSTTQNSGRSQNAGSSENAGRVRSLSGLGDSQKNYLGKLNTIKVFLTENGLSHLIDGARNIIVPLDYSSVLLPLFRWLSMNTKLPKRRRAIQIDDIPTVNTIDDDRDLRDEDEGEDEAEGNNEQASNLNAFGSTHDERRRIQQDIVEGATNQETMSPTCMKGYKCALKWCYKKMGIEMDPWVDKSLDEFIQGYKKIVANKKSRGAMKLNNLI